MTLSKVIRVGVAAALVASVPLTASVAATRPNAAVPVAGSAAVAQGSNVSRGVNSLPILPIAVIVTVILAGLYFAADKDKDGDGALTRG